MPGGRAARLVAQLLEHDLSIATAESLTGGRIAAAITAVPGSSGVFPGGIVSYCDRVKHRLLGVSREDLTQFGAVSEPVAAAMALGAATALETDLALSATGLAGPDGDGSSNPVGTVYLGLYARGMTRVERYVFSGSRAEVQQKSVDAALDMALKWLAEVYGVYCDDTLLREKGTALSPESVK